MKLVLFLLCMGFLGWSYDLQALEKASDFQEVGSADEGEEGPSAKKETKPAAAENEKLLSGTVRVMRKIGVTEVFFKDLSDSYVIPSGRHYSSLYKAFNESQKKGHKVSFRANTKTRHILTFEETPAESSNTGTGSAGGNK